jgi:uncharacterized protein YjdB
VLTINQSALRALACAFILTACGGGDGGTSGPAPAVTSVTIAPSAPVVVAGQNLQLTATVAAVGGASTAVTWTSSDPQIVAVSLSGTITGVVPGTATVRATSVFASNISGTVSVTVNPAPPAVTGVAVTPANPELAVGGQLQMTAAVTVVVVRRPQSWSSSNAAVATVRQPGR